MSVGCSCCDEKPDVGTIVKEAMAQYPDEDKYLLGILKSVQARLGYLSEQAISKIAEEMALPTSSVYGVATFYSLFTVKPKGKHIIRICESAPCYIKGAENIKSALEEELGIAVGETTPDNQFTLEFASCLGVCGVAPAIMIDDIVYGNLTREKVASILQEYRSK